MTQPHDHDTSLAFTIPTLHARGRLVRLSATLTEILSAHGYPPAIESLLAEALVVVALLGTLLKAREGQLTLQAQAEGGAISLLVCDYQDGKLRGYVKHDADKSRDLPFNPTLTDLFGTGYLAITFDQAVSGERYQGIVPLDGANLAQAVEHYFAQSEQIPSLLRVAIEGEVAGGLLMQHLPEGEDGRDRIHTRLDHPDWETVLAHGETVTADELANPAVALDTLAWRLFSQTGEVHAHASQSFARGCRCDADYIRSVIARFPPDEQAAMADEHGVVSVDCAFCARVFPVSLR